MNQSILHSGYIRSGVEVWFEVWFEVEVEFLVEVGFSVMEKTI